MAWVENILNFTNSYHKATSSEGDQLEYLVPFPPEYNSTMKAYWTTDVIVIDPSCSWQTPTTARFVNESLINEVSSTSPIYESTWDVTLAESNLTVSIPNDSFGMFLLSNIFMYLLDFSIRVWQYIGYGRSYHWHGFNFRVREQKFGIQSSCGRFRAFCHRSTRTFYLRADHPCEFIPRPDIQIPQRRRPCVSPVHSTCLYADPSSPGYWEW